MPRSFASKLLLSQPTNCMWQVDAETVFQLSGPACENPHYSYY